MKLKVGGTVALVAAIVAVLVLVVFKSDDAPADRADTFVPADALAYLHISTDRERPQDTRMAKTLAKLPVTARIQDRISAAFGGKQAFDLKRDVRSWLGKEAAVAVTEGGVLLVLSVAKQDTAQGVLTRFAGEQPGVKYRGEILRRFTGGAAALVDDFLLVGPEPLVRESIDVHDNPRKSLAELAEYRRAAEKRPGNRSADGWATGVAASITLPARLGRAINGKSLIASLVPTSEGLRIVGRRLGGSTEAGDFKPELLEAVPREAAGYLGVRGMRRLGALLPIAAGAAGPTVVERLQPLLDEVSDEVAVSVAPGVPDPITTLTAKVKDPKAARSALADVQATIASTLTGSENDTGAVPTFEERPITKELDAYVLTLAGGGELAYAVIGSRVIISNSDAGIERGARNADGVADTDAFKGAVPDLPDPAEAVAFVAVSQLLDLADAAGLDASATYRSVRPDLRKVQSIGATLRRQGSDTIAELNLTIP